MQGEPFSGKARLFGKDYMTRYEPIKQGGRVIGILFIGIDFTQQMAALKDWIKSVKIGQTGYVYALDAGKDKGTLTIHPAKEGKNILDARDASGNAFIQEIVDRKQGVIRYPWMNKEIGDTAPRMKVVVYAPVKNWNWVVGSGSYVDEFTAGSRSVIHAIELAGLVTVLLLGVLLYFLSRRLVAVPLGGLVRHMDEVAQGNYFSRFENPYKDEIGHVYSALQSMQTKLGFTVQETRRLADESLRIKIALDNVSANVMVADPDRRIIYLNKAVEGMFRNAETDIRKQLPQFDAGKLLGASIDGFHKNPQHQAQLLASFTSTYRSTLHIGGRTMTVVANPVLNERGDRLGSVVEWADRTLEVAAEKEIADLVTAAGAGDFSRRLATGVKEGFFLQLAEGINKLVETSERGMSDVARVLKALSTGDLSKRMEGDYQGLFGQLKDDTNATSERLSEIVSQIREATDAINTAAREIASGNSDLSSRTESQASSLEETASSMDELTSTVKQNADNARQANQLSKGASDVAVKGGEVVGQVVHTMGAIAESSKKIADIISVIDGIAFQTNILALNAAVEAARAGEQGRGFAVVAGEVRNLAQRSAAAAKEIKELIGNSVDKVSDGYRLVENAGKTMDEIVGAVKRVTDIMGEITAASQEQSQGIEQVNSAVAQMDEMTQQNAALVEEAAAAAESLQDQAAGLSESVSVFKLAEGGTRLTAPDAVPRLTSRPVAGARPKAGLKPHKPASLTRPRTPTTST